jgi:hypothetical protein
MNVPAERLASLLERLQAEKGRWVTWDEFETWRNRQADLTEEERAELTIVAGGFMIESLANGTVRDLPPQENPSQ